MNMEKICMPLPIIHIIKHMKPTCLKGAVAVDHRAWGTEHAGRGVGAQSVELGVCCVSERKGKVMSKAADHTRTA